MTIASDRKEFRIGGGTLWDGRNLHELYGEAYTPWEWQPKLKKAAEDLGMDLFSSAFDFTAVDFLEEMGVPAHKVASFELVDLPLIQKMARTGKPLIMSTGMASVEEIEEALQSAREAGATQIALAEVHQRLSRACGGDESAHDSGDGAALRSAHRIVRPYDGNRSPRGGGGAGRLHDRKAFDVIARNSGAG